MQKYFLLFISILFVSSCANYKLNYSKDASNWAKIRIAPMDKKIKHSMYMISNTGHIESDQQLPALALLHEKLKSSGKNSSVIFLGNNLHPNGMPNKETKKDRKQKEAQLDAQLAILKNYDGRIIFLPGADDWKKYGLKGIKRQEKYIEKKLNKGIEDDEE